MKPHRVAIVWFRRDLRLTDQPALRHALEHAQRIVPLFIWDWREDEPWRPGGASRWWLHHSLTALDASLRRRGVALVVRAGEAAATITEVAAEAGATLLVWNRLYEPREIACEERVVAAAVAAGLEHASFQSALWCDPSTLRNQQGGPYRVFGPFWRAVERELDGKPDPLPAPKRLAGPSRLPPSIGVGALHLLPRVRWDGGLAEAWKPGEASALQQLRRSAARVRGYSQGRERPDEAHTSRLSPHLHFGEITPVQALAALRSAGKRAADSAGAADFLRELGWREFAHHLLCHFPHTAERCLDERFERMRWRTDAAAIERWRRGMTGAPMVDAGMRELWRTGWMHNRVRMVVASFLTKNLQTHWRVGAEWFWDTLVDADLANNTLNWQWVAGCGADAAPYYRIFNPVLQAERFDPERRYLRRWAPELARLADRWIHRPWAASAKELAGAGVRLGVDYPTPLVDLDASRKAALAAYERLKRG
jgi:deoxyribodipyrimidine photo-lyase